MLNATAIPALPVRHLLVPEPGRNWCETEFVCGEANGNHTMQPHMTTCPDCARNWNRRDKGRCPAPAL